LNSAEKILHKHSAPANSRGWSWQGPVEPPIALALLACVLRLRCARCRYLPTAALRAMKLELREPVCAGRSIAAIAAKVVRYRICALGLTDTG